MKTVIIIGGGIAGLSAAIRLAEKNHKIILLEKRPVLGGWASSFIDPDTGEWVDNCQHVLLRCCSNLMDFYHRLGVDDKIRWYDKYYFIDPEKRISIIKTSRLPAPLHLFPSLFFHSSLSIRDKLAIGYAMYRILKYENPVHENIDTKSWFKKYNQNERTMDYFWKPILVSALNEEIEIAAMRYTCLLFQEGFLKNRLGYQMGIPGIRLSELYSEPSIRFLEKYQGEIRLKQSVKEIIFESGEVNGVKLTDGTVLKGDYYISAVPFDILLQIIPEHVIQSDPDLAKLKNLKLSPITGIHLWFDREFMRQEHLVVLGKTIQWIFNKSRNFRSTKPVQNGISYLGLVVSASNELMSKTRDEIIDMALNELKQIFPESTNAKLIQSRVIKEPKATFSPSVESDKYRPDCRTKYHNFYLAGDWTNTGWPGTMESAVISGYQCANHILT